VRVAIYGSRPDGHAKVVLDVLAGPCDLEVVGLLDDWAENAERRIGALGVIGGLDDLPRLAAERACEGVVLGFGGCAGREEIGRAVEAAGLALPVLVHPDAYVAPSASLGAGAQVLPKASVGADVSVGRGVLVNAGAVVEHDCVLAECVVVDPGAVLAGRVKVGAGAEIGSGATVVPDVEIGPGAMVGAGAAVIGPVAAGETVVGVPARPLAGD
jgi:UDP-perosamine 4-acetyltransferase